MRKKERGEVSYVLPQISYLVTTHFSFTYLFEYLLRDVGQDFKYYFFFSNDKIDEKKKKKYQNIYLSNFSPFFSLS